MCHVRESVSAPLSLFRTNKEKQTKGTKGEGPVPRVERVHSDRERLIFFFFFFFFLSRKSALENHSFAFPAARSPHLQESLIILAMTSAYPHFPLLSLPIATGLAYAPHYIKTAIVLKATKRWNNINPRGQVDKLESKLSPETMDMVKRAESAHINGLETLSVFYGSVLAALHAGVPKDMVSYYAGLFLISRGVYNVLYILNTTELTAGARSSAWFVCMYSCLKMFLAAAATKYY